MSMRYKGAVISATPPSITGRFGTASGAWTLTQEMQADADGTWPLPPNGSLWIWGNNAYGQMGINVGPTSYISSPAQVGSAGNTITPTFAVGNGVLQVRTNGSLWTWGYNASGQLGDGATVDQIGRAHV